MINYIIQVILFQVLFLAVYDLFLNKETFFQKNRAYLIATPLLSFLLPLIKIPSFEKVAVATETIIYLPEILLSPQKVIEKSNWYASVNYIEIIFITGVVVFFVLFLMKLVKIIRLIQFNKAELRQSFKLIFLPNKTKAFSFFNFIFLGKEIPKTQQEKIIAHEMVHSKQKHSADLLLFEFLKIVMWFNPILYFYQKRIATIHEYIADDYATKTNPKEEYIDSLISEVFSVENISFINQFYKKSFLKKRIIMMTKEKSKQVKQLKYLILIPVLVSMLFYTACTDSDFNSELEISKELRTFYHEKDGKIVSIIGKKKSYLDHFVGSISPKGAKEISFEDLTEEEKLEYETEFKLRFGEMKSDSKFTKYFEFKFFKLNNGRKATALIYNFKSKKIIETEEVSFLTIEKTPVFPGCEAGDKACFSKKVQQHFSRNFNADLPKQLGLESGRKRVFIQFKIDTDGHVVDIKARAPHPEITDEVKRVMESLPRMIPGENKGEKVAVKYSIPFTLMVE